MPAERTIGNYVLGPLLGRGGMSEVRSATHRFLDDRVAIKLLRSTAGDADARSAFLAEATQTRAIDHPGVVRVIDVGCDGDDFYLVMELLDGETLATRLARAGRLDEPTVCRLGAAIADGAAAAHARGIIHRDLKPGNIMLVGPAGEPKIVDFGIARQLDHLAARTTGSRTGTPAYMAPEQLTGGLIAPCVDIWALGAILYEALAGRLPFEGYVNGRCPQLFETPRRLGDFAAVAPSLEALIASCLDRDPARRPPSMAAIARALRGEAAEERITEDVAPRIDAQRIDAHRIDAPRIDAQRIDAHRIDAPRIDAQRIDAHRIDAPRIDAQRIDAHRIDAPRIDAQRTDPQRIDPQRINATSIDAHRIDAPRVDAHRIDAHRIDAHRIDAHRIDAPRVDAHRIDAPRVDAPRIDVPGIDVPGIPPRQVPPRESGARRSVRRRIAVASLAALAALTLVAFGWRWREAPAQTAAAAESLLLRDGSASSGDRAAMGGDAAMSDHAAAGGDAANGGAPATGDEVAAAESDVPASADGDPVVATPDPPATPWSTPFTVLVRSAPAGASIIVNGKRVGVTPAAIALRTPTQVLVTRRGYQPSRVRAERAGPILVRLVPLPRGRERRTSAGETLD